MNVGIVDPKVQRPAVGRQPSRPARIHEDTGEPTQLACMRFALVHVTSVDDGAVVCGVYVCVCIFEKQYLKV